MSRRRARTRTTKAAPPAPARDDLLLPPGEPVDVQWDRFWVFLWAGILFIVCFIAVYNALDAARPGFWPNL